MTVFGGNQTPPYIHIKDIVNVYKHFLNNSEIPNGSYNAGFENISILDIAKLIQLKIPSEIITTKSNDPRSYRQNPEKLLGTGFVPKHNISDAIDDIIEMNIKVKLTDLDSCHTVKWMKN